MRIWIVAACVLGLVGASIAAEAVLRVDGNNGAFVDGQGRQRFFRGVNIVFKGDPWHPSTDGFDAQTSLVQEDVDNMKAWGFNAVRLGMMWPGAEPSEGVFNETYLAVMHNLTDMLWNAGIYTIIDFHQDCLAASFCGEGIPEWAVEVKSDAHLFPEPFGKPFSHEKKPPIPSVADCNKHAWSTYQATSAASTKSLSSGHRSQTNRTGSAYQALYNEGRVRQAFVGFWKRIAADYLRHPGVLAYEMINEPWAGDVWEHPSLMVPGVADKMNLAPFYEAVAAGIREVDTEHIVMFETVTWDDIKIGLDQVPGGAAWTNTSALSYHYYLPPNLGIEQALTERAKELKRLNTAGFLTEFDMCNKKEKLVHVLDTCDEHLVSWTGWEYKAFVPITGVCQPFWNTTTGVLDEDRVRILSRTYAPAVAGQTTLVKFDDESSDFALEYTADTSLNADTEIYFNGPLRYPKGVNVVITPAGAATAVVAASNIAIKHNASAHGAVVRVQVTASA